MSNDQSNQGSSFRFTDVVIIMVLIINLFFLYKFLEFSNKMEDIQSKNVPELSGIKPLYTEPEGTVDTNTNTNTTDVIH
jgi:hypothetical protein